MFLCYCCRKIGHIPSRCSILFFDERYSCTPNGSEEGSNLITITNLENVQEDNRCTTSKEEDKVSHVSMEESLDSEREKILDKMVAIMT